MSTELLDEVHAFLGRFVAYPSKEAQVAHSLWIAHTHLMDQWESTPRIAFLSPEKGSGKTRALEITNLLVPRPVMAWNVSTAYLFRKLGDKAGLPTILFDEIDTVFGEKTKKDNEDLRGLINAGHRRGAIAGRCVTRGNTVETEDFPAYCAFALAGIGRLPDTILSRSVVVRMKKRRKDEAVEPYRERQATPEGHALRERLAAWASSVRSTLTEPTMPAGIEDRDADVWEPLLAIADAVGGRWPTGARVAAVALVALSQEDGGGSLGVRLLSDLRTILTSLDKVHTSTIISTLTNMIEAPWGSIKGAPLSDRYLAHLLKAYGIHPKDIRIGTEVKKGYERADFLDAWERYLPPLSPPGSALQGQQELQSSIPVPPANDNPSPPPSKIKSWAEYNRMSDAERAAYHRHDNDDQEMDWPTLGVRF